MILLIIHLFINWRVIDIQTLQLFPNWPLWRQDKVFHSEARQWISLRNPKWPINIVRPLPLLTLMEKLLCTKVGVLQTNLALNPIFVPARHFGWNGGGFPIWCRVILAPTSLVRVLLDGLDELRQSWLRNYKLMVLQQIVHVDTLHILATNLSDVRTCPSEVVIYIMSAFVDEHCALASSPKYPTQVLHEMLGLVRLQVERVNDLQCPLGELH
mmetsp:Transcript_46476/g.85158  ORF Transcript_46476/g.85158 Transcript_46476/m.85158 type:complete len:213 (-) Transcript_46476:682-1320(-)